MFVDRADAGRQLAARLAAHRGPDTVVVGLATGGVPVAYEVACALGVPLEAWVVRPLGLPDTPAGHVGAVAENGHHWLDVAGRDRPPGLAGMAADARREIDLRARRLRHHPRLGMRNRTVILVDDGLATGATTRAAIHAIRQEKPQRVILAVPAAPRASLEAVRPLADAVVCVATVDGSAGIAPAYDELGLVPEERVAELLDRRHLELRADRAAAR